jgi:glycosyltransferase involved in cell wall biosynthesis
MLNPKRILFVAYQSQVAGGEMVLVHLVRAAMVQGWEVEVAIPSRGPLEELLVGCRIHIIPMGSSLHLPTIFKLRQLFKERSPCLVHSHGLLRNLPSRWARLGCPGVQLINTVHMSRRLVHGGHVKGFAFRNWVYRHHDNWTASWADSIVAVGEGVRDDLLEQGVKGENLCVIPNGVPQPMLATREGSRQKILAMTGFPKEAFLMASLSRLSVQKDIPTLIRAAQRVIHARPMARLILCGEGPKMGEAKEWIKRLEMEKNIFMTGHLPQASEWLPAFDVCLSTSLWEGLPLALMEAFIAGLPVVATANSGNLEVLGPLAVSCSAPCGDDQKLAEIVLRLMDDEQERNRVVAVGMERYRSTYNIEAMAQGYLKLYENAHQALV